MNLLRRLYSFLLLFPLAGPVLLLYLSGYDGPCFSVQSGYGLELNFLLGFSGHTRSSWDCVL